ncbi:Mannosyl-oligosaccharide glucosidase [Globisporangium polare]
MALAHVATALLVALAALLLYSDPIREQLRHLPLQFLSDLAPDSTHTSPPSDPPAVAPTPLDFDALHDYVDANSRDALRWGTYRSGLYFGVRSRSYPYYVAAGLLWGSQHEDISQLRHACRQEDRLQKYGWLQHDGRSYGLQSIEDQFNRVQLRTHYVRLHGDAIVDGWASRFEVAHLEPRDERLRKKHVATTKLSLFFYVDLGCEDESLGHPCRHVLKNLIDVAADPTSAPCEGDESATCTQMILESEGVDNGDERRQSATASAPLKFQVRFQLKARESIKHTELRFSGLKDTNVLNVKERLQALAERVPGTNDDEVNLDNIIEEGSTLVVIQAIVDADTTQFQVGDVALDVLFSDESKQVAQQQQPIDALVSTKIETLSRAFEANFEAKFQLKSKTLVDRDSPTQLNESHVAFAQAAFSNLMGGIGYFYGSSLVQHDPQSPQIAESTPKPLFTAVPSRSFFPRGFLWDEGFHQLGISVFDEGIARDVIAHWLGLMESDGYIAREQILGQSARRRVPTEFLVQHVEHANPPSLLLCIEKMLLQARLKSPKEQQELKTFVELIFPFLERWYEWLVRTQRGPVTQEPDAATFRWRGRKPNDGKLISNTLSSGLDDYPRASSPSENEMHVDLVTWMVKASDIMGRLSSFIGLEATKTQAFGQDKARFLKGLDLFHWNDELQSFFDVGDHSEDGRIEHHVVIRCRNNENGQIVDATASPDELRSQRPGCPASHSHYLFPLGDGKGGLKMQPIFIPGTTKLQHVKHIGYVSIFPLLLKVLPPDSPKLRALLGQIADPQHLWSPFGLRSMSTRDPFYERENAPGDNPYWRGSIWINANYLALDALHHYAQPSTGSPFQKEFQIVYDQLRANVVQTIWREYERTGYLWEQYSGDVHAEQQYGKGQRCHPFSGWTALVVNIMAEAY